MLVLINEIDWDLCDTYDYILEDNDTVTFMSTIHGG